MEKNSKKEKQSFCPIYKKCGACQLQNMSYEEQLSWKMGKTIRLLSRFGKVNEIIGMEYPYHYRNKAHAAFGRTRGGKVISGIYQSGTHTIAATDSCFLENPLADEIITTIRRLLISFKLPVYDEDAHTGFLRHVLIRTGAVSGQVLVVLVTGTPRFPGKNHFLAALLKAHPQITTVVQNINASSTSMVLGEQQKVLYGSGYIEDELCGCLFRISARSFYQINHTQTQKLYETAMEYAALRPEDVVIDAYCGIGTIGLIAAGYGCRVIGAELNADAVRDAKVNQIRNGRDTVSFVNADAGEFMRNLAKSGEKADVVFTDPPRSGCSREFLSSLAALHPDRIVYISCNPETQQRDLLFLTANGYRVRMIQPVDMFPHTAHVETVVLLSHKKPDGHINVKVEFGEGEGKVPLDDIAQRAESYKPKERVTYKMIKEYIEVKYGFKVHTAYIAEVKRDLGLPMYDARNAVEELKQPRKHPTPEKVEAIKDALKYFGVCS